MIKKIFQISAIFILGAIGGMIWQAILLPTLARNPNFENFWFIKEFRERETIIFPKEEIRIQENVALSQAVEKVENIVVGIKTKTKQGKEIFGSGLILTSDGQVVTLSNLLPEESDSLLFINGQIVSFEILKRDDSKNLILLKIEKNGLPTAGFLSLDNIKRGQTVFLIGTVFIDSKAEKIVNTGIVKYFGRDSIRTNIFEKDILNGSPLFDIEGNVLGINTVDFQGIVTALPVSEIQRFAGF